MVAANLYYSSVLYNPGRSPLSYWLEVLPPALVKKNSTGGDTRQKIKWGNIWLFAFIFLLAGLLSEIARKNDWPNRRPINYLKTPIVPVAWFLVVGRF
jgi:hypothetical protein